MKKLLILIFLLAGVSCSFGQEATFGKVKSEFDSFQYEKLIKTSDEVLAKGILSDSLRIEIYVMRAVAFYSMGDESSTMKSFENILMIRRTYNPDPSQISPKLISFFDEAKADFLKNNPEPVSVSDSTKEAQPIKLFSNPQTKRFILENLVMPGIAQWQLGKNPKGIILATASTINLAAMIYFLFDTKNKENDYLRQTDKILIQQKYDDYNRSYRIRNTLIVSYALIWIYSQIDLFFFNEDESIDASRQISYLQFKPDLVSDYKINFKIPF